MERTREELDEIRKKYRFNKRIYQKNLTELVDESDNTISAQLIGTPFPIFTDQVYKSRDESTGKIRIHIPHPEIRDTFSLDEIRYLFPETKKEYEECWIDAMLMAATGGPEEADAYLLGNICIHYHPEDEESLQIRLGYPREFVVCAAQYFKLL